MVLMLVTLAMASLAASILTGLMWASYRTAGDHKSSRTAGLLTLGFFATFVALCLLAGV